MNFLLILGFNRRPCVSWLAGLTVLLAAWPALAADNKPAWRDAATNVRVWVSQHGYNPEHPKTVTTPVQVDRFEVRRAGDGAVVFAGELREVSGDFGTFRQGDFTALRDTGEYYVQIGEERSFRTFRIAPHRWDDLQKAVAWHYFGLRRMGEDNVMGNLGDFRLVNWEHGLIERPDGPVYKYIGRAWADGDDGRVYPSASLVVAQYCALKDSAPFWDRGDWIYSQVRWGLDGALSFLEKDGSLRYLLHFWDHQWATFDNRFYTGDEKRLVDCFDSEASVNEYNHANPEGIASSLLLGPAYAVCVFRDRDPAFFARVQAWVQRGYDEIDRRYRPHPQKSSLGSWIWLNVLMARMTGEERYLKRAVAEADRLLALQQTTPVALGAGTVRGWFHRDTMGSHSPGGEKPEQEVMITPWIYQGLFQLITALPEHGQAPRWREAVRSYAHDYLMTVAQRNPFGYTPMKIETLGLKRRDPAQGGVAYQYFGKIGRQFHQIGNAAFLLQAGRLLDDPACVQAAWRQFFWFSGHNPAGYGLIHGFATNLNSGQYYPDVLGRAFPGGTINGAVGDEQDNPNFEKYNEYYTYANLNLLWFATQAGARQFSAPVELWPKEIEESPHTAQPETHPRASFPVRMKSGFAYRFTAVVRDDPEHRVDWTVDGIVGGAAAVGMITADGTYTAPRLSEERTVTVSAISRRDPAHRAETRVTLLPAPGAVPALQVVNENGKARLSWKAAEGNPTGYTIWKRLPVSDERVGTIFEMVGAVGPEETGYVYPNDRIKHYEDQLVPEGTEFVIKAYHMRLDPTYVMPVDGAPYSGLSGGWMRAEKPSPERIDGFGPESPVAVFGP